jgi:hypothetical protein
MFMAAVAIIGIGIWASRAQPNSKTPTRTAGVVSGDMVATAARYAEIATFHRQFVDGPYVCSICCYGGKDDTGSITPSIEAWHKEMAEKYEQAAHSPWLPLKPDRPKPAEDCEFIPIDNYFNRPTTDEAPDAIVLPAPFRQPTNKTSR